MSEETTTVELNENTAKILEMIEGMTVLEMSELVKAMEDKFGVSAAAPVAVAAVPVAALSRPPRRRPSSTSSWRPPVTRRSRSSRRSAPSPVWA